jgi:hypothetical protein
LRNLLERSKQAEEYLQSKNRLSTPNLCKITSLDPARRAVTEVMTGVPNITQPACAFSLLQVGHKVHIYLRICRVPQCLSPRRNWDSPPRPQANVSHPLEPPGTRGGGHTRLWVRGWGGVPIQTTGETVKQNSSTLSKVL